MLNVRRPRVTAIHILLIELVCLLANCKSTDRVTFIHKFLREFCCEIMEIFGKIDKCMIYRNNSIKDMLEAVNRGRRRVTISKDFPLIEYEDK